MFAGPPLQDRKAGKMVCVCGWEMTWPRWQRAPGSRASLRSAARISRVSDGPMQPSVPSKVRLVDPQMSWPLSFFPQESGTFKRVLPPTEQSSEKKHIMR